MAYILGVKQLIGENCITLEDGQRIYEIIHPLLKAHQPVELDFLGERIFASPFMNAAIGQLLQDISPDTLNQCLIIDRAKITSVGLAVMRQVIQNAKEYYASEPFGRAVDEVLANDIPE